MTRYETNFKLELPVKDMPAAIAYLTADDMTKYLLNDDRCKCPEAIIEVRWELRDLDSGKIVLLAQRDLTEEELTGISDWISGQCSDGLGEGFEQQDFATYEDEDSDDEWEDDYECQMASFDWETNDYPLKKVFAA